MKKGKAEEEGLLIDVVHLKTVKFGSRNDLYSSI
jgi:hypothetical protein